MVSPVSRSPIALALTERDAGAKWSSHVDRDIVVSLSENSTAGFIWLPSDDTLNDFELIASELTAGAMRPGAVACRSLSLRPRRTGTLTLRLVKVRPWEGRPAKTWEVQIVALP